MVVKFSSIVVVMVIFSAAQAYGQKTRSANSSATASATTTASEKHASSAAVRLSNYAALAADLKSVPQNLLALAHTREAQSELKLDDKREQWESMLRELDAVWWPSRIQPMEKQRPLVAQLEHKVVQGLEKVSGREAVIRLRQLELQSQGARALVRPEVVKFIQLDTKQLESIQQIFDQTDALAESKQENGNDPTQKYATAKKSEAAKAIALLHREQLDRLRILLGAMIDTSQFERIYPFAPELIDSKHWTPESPVTLKSLRGKVVLVHFYAFQCHNCVANFEHYKRWHKTLREKGVHVVGIQTPETSAERDTKQVIAAAKREGFEFPVLIDIENENWNAWGNTMWPTVYVVDKRGYVRFWWQGELNWQGATGDQKIESIVDRLLAESD